MSAILRSFATTAEREAYVFDRHAIGRIVYDAQDGLRYLVYGEGEGADVLFPLAPSAGGTPDPHAASHEDGGSDELDVTALGGFPGGTTDYLRADGTFATPPGGGGGLSGWYPDAPSASPHACDDEFDAGSLNAKWTVWDPSGLFTKALNTTRQMYSIAGTATGTNRIAGIGQPVPGGVTEYALYAKCFNIFHCPASGAAAWDAGIFLAQDIGANPSTADVYTISSYQFDASGTAAAAQGMRSRTHSAYNTPTGTLEITTDPRAYIRVRVSGTTAFFDTSNDGVSWFRQWNGTLSFTPSYFGLFASFAGAGSGPSGMAYFDFFRCFTGAGTSGVNATSIGDFI